MRTDVLRCALSSWPGWAAPAALPTGQHSVTSDLTTALKGGQSTSLTLHFLQPGPVLCQFQGHAAGKWQGWALNTDRLSPQDQGES